VTDRKATSTAILDVSGLQWASEQSIVTAVLGRRPGVLQVEVNPVAQTATVVFDPARASMRDLRTWVIECGYHCAGQSVPAHICDPMVEPDPPVQSSTSHAVRAGGDSPTEHLGHAGHAGHVADAGTAVAPGRKEQVGGARHPAPQPAPHVEHA